MAKAAQSLQEAENNPLGPLSVLNRVGCSGQGSLLPCSLSPKQDAILKPGSPMHLIVISKNVSSISKQNFPHHQLLLFQMHSGWSMYCAYILRVWKTAKWRNVIHFCRAQVLASGRTYSWVEISTQERYLELLACTLIIVKCQKAHFRFQTCRLKHCKLFTPATALFYCYLYIYLQILSINTCVDC